MIKTYNNLLVMLFLALIGSSCMQQTEGEYHVAKTGDDLNTGSYSSPFLTISAAARIADPGDIITVHEGIYRESIILSRGGNSESERIIYRAAEGEDVTLKGSEQIDKWIEEDKGIWKAELPTDYFNDFNPYEKTIGWISTAFLNGGAWTHCGDVYLNGEAFYEKQTMDEVRAGSNTWFTDVDSLSSITRIWANFGEKNPNTELTEINVRESIIYPSDTLVNYITIRGFTIKHSASGWGPPGAYQGGAIETNGGHHWIVENCAVINAKTNGFSMGNPKITLKNGRGDYDHTGHHIIRNNIFRRCGQSAIVGNNYNTASYILGNYIAETAYRNEFWGFEPAAIKLHNSVDLVIENNHIAKGHEVFGLWIDFGHQNTRITRNYIAAILYVEMNVGPILIDNNILIGGYSNRGTTGAILVHNFFALDSFRYVVDPREPRYWKPHTNEYLGRRKADLNDERWLNNIFVHQGLNLLNLEETGTPPKEPPHIVPRVYVSTGLHPLTTFPGCDADYNIYLNGAKPSPLDENSVTSDFNPEFSVKDDDGNVTIRFLMNSDGLKVNCPLINTEYLGIFETAQQGVENPDGSPITVINDILEKPRDLNNLLAGPFADLKEGKNSYTVFTISDKGPQLSE